MTYDNWKLQHPPEYDNDQLSAEQRRQLATAEVEHLLKGVEELEDELDCYINFTSPGCGQVDELTLEKR